MSILSGFSPFKKYKKTSDGYKLQSDWTHSDTVEFTDGSNLTTKVGTTSIASIGDGSITGAISSVNTNKADLVNGKVPLSQIPNTALNIRKEVANDTARFALTTADVQTGDTVKVLSTDMIYLVVDDTNLDNENGYMPYAQTVTWDTISGKPSDIAYYDVESAQTGTAMSPVLRQSDLVTSTTSSSTTKPLAAYAGNTLNTKINNVRDTLAGDIAETYSTTATYAVGDYCLRNQVLYKCNTAITSGESWNSSHWTQVKAGDELETINTEIGDTSISSIGDGSITGAISSLNSTLTTESKTFDGGHLRFDIFDKFVIVSGYYVNVPTGITDLSSYFNSDQAAKVYTAMYAMPSSGIITNAYLEIKPESVRIINNTGGIANLYFEGIYVRNK